MNRHVAAAICIVAAIGYASPAAAQGCAVQLGQGATIAPPADNLPPDLRRWSGLWGGIWDATLCTTLAVLQINPDGTAFVQYGWGVAPQWNIRQPGFSTHQARISDDTLTFTIFGDRRAVYRWNGDRLNGQYIWSGGSQRSTLTKAQ